MRNSFVYTQTHIHTHHTHQYHILFLQDSKTTIYFYNWSPRAFVLPVRSTCTMYRSELLHWYYVSESYFLHSSSICSHRTQRTSHLLRNCPQQQLSHHAPFCHSMLATSSKTLILCHGNRWRHSYRHKPCGNPVFVIPKQEDTGVYEQLPIINWHHSSSGVVYVVNPDFWYPSYCYSCHMKSWRRNSCHRPRDNHQICPSWLARSVTIITTRPLTNWPWQTTRQPNCYRFEQNKT